MSAAPSRSPLHSLNEKLGARFVDFGGLGDAAAVSVSARRAPGGPERSRLVRRFPPRPILVEGPGAPAALNRL